MLFMLFSQNHILFRNKQFLNAVIATRSKVGPACRKHKKSTTIKVEDLRSHIQRYVNEVKRIEELLALREKERTELLDQYKHLADEVDTAETYGRKLELQVSQLKLDVSTRTAELKASELRLENMEKDLVEISLSNENYRTQVALLSSKVDIAETELRSLRSHSSWAVNDMTDVNKLSDELVAQKLELQRQLNIQTREMENQADEIRMLRSEIEQLTLLVEAERLKSVELENRIGEYQHASSDQESGEKGKER